MGTFGQDLIFALRMMRKNLGFTAAAVLCLIVGNWGHYWDFHGRECCLVAATSLRAS
jgi:hypothetical protein